MSNEPNVPTTPDADVVVQNQEAAESVVPAVDSDAKVADESPAPTESRMFVNPAVREALDAALAEQSENKGE